MKKYFFLLAAMFIGAVCLTSCGDDDDLEDAIDDIISGKVKPTVTIKDGNPAVFTATFKDVYTETLCPCTSPSASPARSSPWRVKATVRMYSSPVSITKPPRTHGPLSLRPSIFGSAFTNVPFIVILFLFND